MADTSSYFVAAYIVAASIYAAYAISLIVRAGRVRARIAALAESSKGRPSA
ncbi:MAG: hypothetical protein JWO05_2147 [Gemmatimonadetes bacterium]|nr:hypothetical protein [Gemmatimonadota bacterium]